MEARSLADLNLLAANPPQYPINPTGKTTEPLTLYISRVPGTRGKAQTHSCSPVSFQCDAHHWTDVILSPFKPQRKNVTADDVASSFYYIHLDIPQPSLAPDSVQPSLRDETFTRSSEDSVSGRAIQRKPLPSDARPVNSDGPPPVPLGQPMERRTMDSDTSPFPSVPANDELPPLPTRQPPPRPMPQNDSGIALADHDARLPPIPTQAHRSQTTRKPLGPRPMVMDSLVSPAEAQDKGAPPLPRRPRAVSDVNDMSRARTRPRIRTVTRSLSPAKQIGSGSSPFTLTLIRRDPGTGNQWNVGKIHSRQDDLTGEDDDRDTAPDQRRASIDIQIETSGYAKFRGIPSKNTNHDAEIRALLSGAPANDVVHHHLETGLFSRQVGMTYSKSWAANLKDKLHRSTRGHGRERGYTTQDSGTADIGSAEVLDYYAPGTKPRGYVFSSPWDGKCEFRTGSGGRSLRCHHSLYDAHSRAYNPLVADRDGSGAFPSSTSAISELRFNLPGPELFQSDKTVDALSRDVLHGNFGKLFRPSSDSDEYPDQDDDAVSPFDVDLGRERAGGGNRGKRAKLGKLIIYNDGLKMLDLIVAANMGVWWTAWEKSF